MKDSKKEFWDNWLWFWKIKIRDLFSSKILVKYLIREIELWFFNIYESILFISSWFLIIDVISHY